MVKMTPAFYGLALICFFLPFTRISCADQTLMAVNGTQLITGFEIQSPLPSEAKAGSPDAATRIEPNPWIMAAASLALLGLLASLKNPKAWLARYAGIGLALALLAFKVGAEQKSAGELQKMAGMLRLDFLYGFWVALASGLIAAILARSEAKDDTPHSPS